MRLRPRVSNRLAPWTVTEAIVAFALVIILAVSLALLTGCESPGQPVVTSNPAMHVELMFEHDGVKVYRFRDSGYDHYYADARGSVSCTLPSGKTTRRDEVVTADTTRYFNQ